MRSSDEDKRSALMARVRQKNTSPELAVRSLLRAAGLRYRLHRADLPGRPDIVLPGRRVAIFVHGCFWHRHADCKLTTTPKNNAEFWLTKFERNVERDAANNLALEEQGWLVRVIWECETRSASALSRKIQEISALPVRPPQTRHESITV